VKHVAIDLGGRESQICIRDGSGVIVEERRYQTRLLPRLMKSWEPSRVIVETSAEAFAVADAALACGHEVRVVPATLVKTLGVGERGMKTDRRDARKLSEVSCRIDLPSVHVPSELSRRLKSVCGNREELIECRTKLINNARGWLRTQLWRVRTGATSSFPKRVREHATTTSQAVPDFLERTLVLIESITAQIRIADHELEEIAKNHPVCLKLMTVPGVGPVTAVRFLAAIDDVTRFPNAHSLQSYVGLTPGEHSSSDSERRTSITKAGPSKLRRALVQAAWCGLRSRSNDPMLRWARELANRKHRFIAVVALARKLAGVLFAIWRDGSTYTARLASTEATN
jgi:transposase